MNKLLVIAIFIIFLVIGLLLGAINLQITELNFFWFTLSMPLSLLISVVLFLGILISWFSFSLRLFKFKREISNLKRSQEKLISQDSK